MPISQNPTYASRFAHERLLAYQRAREFHGFVAALKPRLPRGLGELFDQLLRASRSVCLALAEGANAYTPGIKREHFRRALASLGECASALDLIELETGGALWAPNSIRHHLDHTAALTVGLTRRLEPCSHGRG